jgi:hypothetical protein
MHLDLNKYNVFFNKFSDLFKIFKFYKFDYIFTTFKTEDVPVLNSAPHQEGKGSTGGIAACIVINLGPRWEVSGQIHIRQFTLSTHSIRGWVQSGHCREENSSTCARN